MIPNSLQRALCVTTLLACASQTLKPQVNSGGVVATSSAVFDYTNAGQTIPARKAGADPATCTPGEQYFNTTSNVAKACTAPNTWTTYTPSGISGGIPYFSTVNAMSSSAMLSANGVVTGGGAGATPKTTGVTIDSSNNLFTPGTITAGSGGNLHGKLALGELPSNGGTTDGWEAPDLLTTSLSLVFPNANPAANSIMLFPAPASGQSQWSWSAIPNCLDAGGNHLNFNSSTGAITCGASSSGAAQTTISVANAASPGTTLNTLAKLTGTPSTAVIATNGDTGGVVGITTAGAGTTGLATITYMGIVPCIFDGPTTAGDYIQISSTVAGNCHDTGSASYPAGGQVIGRVLSTNGSNGAYNVDLFPPEIKAGSSAGLSSLNTLTGSVSIMPGLYTTVTSAGQNITVDLNTTMAMSKVANQANGAKTCIDSSGSGTAYVCTTNPLLVSGTSLVIGTLIWFSPGTTNTGACTVDPDGAAGPIAAASIKQADGVSDPFAGMLVANQWYPLVYDGTVFRMPAGSPGALQGVRVGSALPSAATITPTAPIHHVTGTAQILTITAPGALAQSGMGGCVALIPDGLWTTSSSGNIALASTAVVSKQLTMCWDSGTSKWYPSY